MNPLSAQTWLEDIRGTQVLPLIRSDAKMIRVEAGPGTGKTFGLVRRVERILHPEGLGVPGPSVLVVAFNRVIAKSLEQDILTRLGKIGYSGLPPNIRTIHSLCAEVAGAKRLLLPHEEVAMLYDVLHSDPRLQEAYPRHSKAAQALRDHEAGHVSHPGLWLACEKWLRRHHASLINDLPNLLLDRIHHGDLPECRYTHIVVDEFQDLTPEEQSLIVKLLEPDGSLVALGDPRQSIYHFRGNDREGLQRLESIVGAHVESLSMTECQRCPADIVTAANLLMTDSNADPMVPGSSTTANVHVVVWDNPDDEANGMAAAIASKIAQRPTDKHLIITTRRAYGYMVRDAFSSIDKEISVNLCFSESPLETWPVREAFLLFCLLSDADAPTWRAWLGYQTPVMRDFKPPKRNAPAYLCLLEATKDCITEEVISQVADGSMKMKGVGSNHVKERAERFCELRAKYEHLLGTPRELVEELFAHANWDLEVSRDPAASVIDFEILRQNALAACEVMGDLANSGNALKKVARRLRGQIATREPLDSGSGSCVQVATLWSAKGVTADHVYVLGLNDEMIPGTRNPAYPGTELDHYEEQRRLFYVTITRCKQTLVLSRSRQIRSTAAYDLGITNQRGDRWWTELHVCPFLREIARQLPGGVSGNTWTGC